MELQIKAYKAQPIEWNYEELKTQLLAKLQDYKTLQYTPEQIQAAKTDRANLNSLKKALSDERIRRKKEFLEPFDTFEAQIKELCNLIEEPVKLIDAQIREVEEREKADKRNACIEIFNSMEKPEWLTFEQIENPKWLNKTTSEKAIRDEIIIRIRQINNDVAILNGLSFAFEALEEYKRTLDASKALSEGRRLSEIQKRKAEIEKNVVAESPIKDDLPFEDSQAIECTLIEEKVEEKGVWLSFKAFLTASQAVELKAFCEFNKIQIKPIKEE